MVLLKVSVNKGKSLSSKWGRGGRRMKKKWRSQIFTRKTGRWFFR
jgi:hypothetical protein